MSPYSSYVLLISAVVLVVNAAPKPDVLHSNLQRAVPQIVSIYDVRDEAGQFSHQHQASNGAIHQEQGVLQKTRDGRELVLVKRGFYSYTSPEGVPIHITYTADEDGFHPEGDSIPKAAAAPTENVPLRRN